MSSSDALERLLGGAALAGVRQRLRRAFAQVPAGQVPASVRLSGLLAHEVEALQSFVSRPPRLASSVQVDLGALDARLRAAGVAAGLRAALEALDGPIVTGDERRDAAAAWTALAADAPHAALRALLSDPRALGLLKRLAGGDAAAARRLGERVALVLDLLPAPGWPLARLAARSLGDAHALDAGRPEATLVLAALRRGAAGDDAETVRSVWAAQGVAVNELARPALALNLPGGDAAPGQPQHWSLRRLLREPPAWRVAGRDVFVCENPNVVALAADALGARCAPLVCTEGMPAAAQRALLRQLVEAGARLHYHGDFDWPGIAIGNQVLRAVGAQPWRFGAADYRAAVADPAAETAGLVGAAVPAIWDDALAPAMRDAGIAVPEEAVFDALVADLGG